jgi:uncharacterized damage-inducible protein DinB
MRLFLCLANYQFWQSATLKRRPVHRSQTVKVRLDEIVFTLIAHVCHGQHRGRLFPCGC